MAGFDLRIKPSAVKELERIPRIEDRRRIVARIESLAETPRPDGCTKLSGREQYQIRQGSWRIVYSVDDEAGVVLVVKVGHRRDVYR
jgi:mRNA interferase RelE/StbE